MTWRLAKSLEQLRKQINDAYPNRSRSSDGTIGDAAHSARTSDHNPNPQSVVCALDITHDPKRGPDAGKFARMLAKQGDARIKYIISNGEICSGPNQGYPAWKWRKYTGKSPHTMHFHVSVRSPAKFYDDAAPWDLQGMPAPIDDPVVRDYIPPDPEPMLRRGVKGDNVLRLQTRLNQLGAKLTVDGDFGARTEAAVKKFQKANGLVADGIVGAYSWQKLKEKK